jgi:catechol 2,3-dioxygenase-like lactoylglutathione lyase family enzyme
MLNLFKELNMYRINGIQQLGVGVTDVREAFDWYRKFFGMDILIFEEKAVANLMLPHTAGQPRERHAILAMNMQGGGGFEIWQHTGKTPEKPAFEIRIGDLGIYSGKIKTQDINRAWHSFKENTTGKITAVLENPAGNPHFFLTDPFGNWWNIIEEPYLFTHTPAINGGISGAIIGTDDIGRSLIVYQDILGYKTILADQTGVFEDWKEIPGGEAKCRRVILKREISPNGALTPLFGPSVIELVQALDRNPASIYQNRIWGDPGFIHLCFDITGLDTLRDFVRQKGFPFTVDSAMATESFDMGETAGSFAYIRSTEGTLIEFVETHKVPLVKKIGWYMNLRNRGDKPLPRWMLKLFSLKRVK